jgi:hypothetical protein
MSRLDAMVAREWTDRDGNTKTSWTKIGVAFPAKSGNGYSITFEALPIASLNRDGKLECRVLLREPLPPRDDGGAAHEPRRATGSAFAAQDLDDDVPF